MIKFSDKIRIEFFISNFTFTSRYFPLNQPLIGKIVFTLITKENVYV